MLHLVPIASKWVQIQYPQFFHQDGLFFGIVHQDKMIGFYGILPLKSKKPGWGIGCCIYGFNKKVYPCK